MDDDVNSTMHSPALLVLDEPTSSLDPDVALRARRGIIEQCEAGGAALLATPLRPIEWVTGAALQGMVK
jgi:ABC-2 type transport system ATP-binding protein